jgi:small GTP-binding protein
MSELSGTLGAVRARVERQSQTWESSPVESGADAVYLAERAGVAPAPTLGVWLSKRIGHPEEDQLAEALEKVLAARGIRPAHAPINPSSKDGDSLAAQARRLADMQKQLSDEQNNFNANEEALTIREMELKECERCFEVEQEKQRQLEEAWANYPVPFWLQHCDGTINVAVVGNSGAGKSLLINKLRKLKPGSEHWAPVGVKETTFAAAMYVYPGFPRVRLWDLPGAGTTNFPQESYIRDTGLRYFDSVLILAAGRFTTTETLLREELMKYGVPRFMVRSKIDVDVYNERKDNDISEDQTLQNIHREFAGIYGDEPLYLVSSRYPERYDMAALIRHAFPGLDKHMQSADFLFGDSANAGWGEAWAMPTVLSPVLAGAQGQWRDTVGGERCVTYFIDGQDAHVTLPDGAMAKMTIMERNDGKAYWCDRWYIDRESVSKATHSGELRWTPLDIRDHKPLVWRWTG